MKNKENQIFKLEYLKINDYPQLEGLDLKFLNNIDFEKSNKPYTSVIIGQNGLGKSYILRSISVIFRELEKMKREKNSSLSISFSFEVQYYIGEDQYRVIFKRNHNKKIRTLEIFKNAYSFDYLNRDGEFVDEIRKCIIKINDLEFPERLIVNSVVPTDRFIWYNSAYKDFYQYLGVRSTKSTTSTQSAIRRTIKNLFNSIVENSNFINIVIELLTFLDFDISFKVHYTTKINKLFFSEELKEEDFVQYYEHWWDENFVYSNRKKENPIWSIPYYNNNFKGNPEAISRIVKYLNEISKNNERLIHKNNSSSKILSIDILDKNNSRDEIELISHLEKLDIINVDGIKLKKSNSALSLDEISSGEFHLLVSLIGLFSCIKSNSLILIDEPEISLHPNWQMRYISFLKNVFEKYSTCHFILTTHSHFLVSDLESGSSSVIALEKENGRLRANLIDGSGTFGWSAEEVLLKVFRVPTSRNYYVAEKVGEILDLISKPIEVRDILLINNKVNLLKEFNLDKLNSEDPLANIIINLINKYGEN